MNAIEIRNLSKSFRGMYAVDHLNMTAVCWQFGICCKMQPLWKRF